ncbi:FAD-binding oxidoreductase [Ferrimonas balearica]|uniref:FAD-binding oxidoreductase n=1 Tax=Ferrimonas balearica TaxID=44012 RepID=UPI001C9A118E|nr:FAD-binding oxidoreductase [Ferrimonas balearica]MBY5922274.1 FAD-binding oxidoreductase [Ferrimonas balearica]MBY5994386.1 FAD-binding oxidoreductase [Ferrimonas balearica]
MERRWNGWGRPDVAPTLPETAAAMLEERLGPGKPLGEASLAQALTQVPPSRLPESSHWSLDPELRLRHSRGQSLPDWLALKSGQLGHYPDAIAQPSNDDELRALLDQAHRDNLVVIPYGGGTSVAGHINVPQSERPVVTLSLARMNRLLHLDPISQLATFGAGIAGPDLEAALNAQGFTLGHFPQSFELSTLGGWVASRSSGQQSLTYGRIEQLFAGGVLHTLTERWVLPTVPASAAGPDWRETILGSEGRLGVLSQVTVRIRPLPETERFCTSVFRNYDDALKGLRTLIQSGLPAGMLRLSHPEETRTQLALALSPDKKRWLDRYLALRDANEPAMLVWEGGAQFRAIRRHLNQYGAVMHSQTLGQHWHRKRFHAPYLREALWQAGYCVDTLETATDWSNIETLRRAIEQSLNNALASEDQPVLVFTHISHVYRQGASLYTTYLFPNGDNFEHSLLRWRRLKHAASAIIVEHGGTISHQHGVGRDHAPYLDTEKGPVAQAALRNLLTHFDPRAQLNPGALLEEGECEA